MKTRFRPFPPVSCAYGAPMGRRDTLQLNPEEHAPDMLACAGPAGEYDAGGAYWGLPARAAKVPYGLCGSAARRKRAFATYAPDRVKPQSAPLSPETSRITPRIGGQNYDKRMGKLR